MSCEYDCVYKEYAIRTKQELEGIIEESEEWVLQENEAARRGWGDYAAQRIQDRQREEAARIDQLLEIDGLLCNDTVCGFALESVRKVVDETSIDIKLNRENM